MPPHIFHQADGRRIAIPDPVLYCLKDPENSWHGHLQGILDTAPDGTVAHRFWVRAWIGSM